MIDMKKTYKTRDGRAARILATDLSGPSPIAAAVKYSDGEETIYQFHSDGCLLLNELYTLDLIEFKPVREGWVNVYPWQGLMRPFRFHETNIESGRAYNTKQDADRDARPSRIACIKIQFTEGEGL